MTIRATLARVALGATLAFAATTTGCSKVSIMRGEIQGLGELVEQAERNGAKRCAPRELALARAHIQFADVELADVELPTSSSPKATPTTR